MVKNKTKQKVADQLFDAINTLKAAGWKHEGYQYKAFQFTRGTSSFALTTKTLKSVSPEGEILPTKVNWKSNFNPRRA